MNYEKQPEQPERTQVNAFYDQLEQLAKAGATFDTTKTYLRSQGLEVAPAMTSTRMEIKQLGIERVLEADPVVSLELEPDPNTAIAQGVILFGTVPITLMVSYGGAPLEATENGGFKYRGLFDTVPHVAVSGFVGEAFYQKNWVVSDEVEKAVAAKNSRRLEKLFRGEPSMRV